MGESQTLLASNMKMPKTVIMHFAGCPQKLLESSSSRLKSMPKGRRRAFLGFRAKWGVAYYDDNKEEKKREEKYLLKGKVASSFIRESSLIEHDYYFL